MVLLAVITPRVNNFRGFIQCVVCIPVMCQQGYVSKTGLEPCFPCPRGYFQPEQGKSSCFLCPDSVKTRDPGSTDITDCEGISVSAASYSSIPTSELVINECFATPCQNGGSCVNLTAGFTCQCLSGWKGEFSYFRSFLLD